MKDKDKLIRLNEVFRITNRAEENIRIKIEQGLINKYDKNGNKLENPLQETGFFKLKEVLNAYDIKDYEKIREEFVRKRHRTDSVVVDIIPEIKIVNSLEKLKKIPSNAFDTCISFFPYDNKIKNSPFSRIEQKKLNPIKSHKLWIKEIVRILNKKGNYLIHSTPEYLPYYGVYLDKYMHFKYWLSNMVVNEEVNKTAYSSKRLRSVTNGTLFYLKSDKGFRLNRIRETVYCEYCGKNIKDYGGKKLLIHKNGAIISDVWKNITEKDGYPSDELLSRLINLTCDNKSKLLLAPFNGDLHERYK